MNIFVALSGGVDSSVAAHMLKEAGHSVTGVFIRVWQPDFIECSQDEEERAAKRAAAYLGIPFLRVNLIEEYKKEVVDYMIAEYKKGRTPNPDVLCNRAVKFGGLWEYARSHGADALATGHHAQVLPSSEGFQLVRGVDTQKDQSYFLWKLTQEDLSHTYMPIGALSKDAVRSYARAHDIPSAHKPDSQGLCFIGHIDLRTFLSHFIIPHPGKVLNTKGEVIGEHDGAEFLTIGQRTGFRITTTDPETHTHYVVKKDSKTHTVTVSSNKHSQQKVSVINIVDTQWMHAPDESREYVCQLRYHGTEYSCRIKDSKVHLIDEEVIPTPGQSVVFYEKNVCIGGGVVA